jgi:MFS transporter, SHS family, lactate transporter
LGAQGIFVTPLYLFTRDPAWVVAGFIIQGLFLGSIYGQNPSYLCERFPTEVRATASGFVYHQGAIFGGLIAPILSYFANEMKMGYAMPMMIGTTAFTVLVVIFILLGPETRGKEMTSELEVFAPADD